MDEKNNRERDESDDSSRLEPESVVEQPISQKVGDATATEAERVSTSSGEEGLSPSGKAILGGFFALLATGMLFPWLGQEAAETIVVTIMLGVPIFVAGRYIFKAGTAEASSRFVLLVKVIVVILLLGAVVDCAGGSGGFCAYRVGCN